VKSRSFAGHFACWLTDEEWLGGSLWLWIVPHLERQSVASKLSYKPKQVSGCREVHKPD